MPWSSEVVLSTGLKLCVSRRPARCKSIRKEETPMAYEIIELGNAEDLVLETSVPFGCELAHPGSEVWSTNPIVSVYESEFDE
jgi:hypothetical protein